MRNKTILITGGTGSLGQILVKEALRKKAKKIIVYSRHEFEQVEMRRNLEDSKKVVRYFIGDVRDTKRLWRAFANVEIVIHVAALKHVDVAEYNPFEAIQTNIYGAENLINAAIDRGVEKVLAISSDKAVNPANLYGATKLCADKLFVAANAYSGKRGTKFSVIRYGNFANSRGSVLPYFRALVRQGIKDIPITDFAMTRFHITLERAVSLAFSALKTMKGGEIFAPKMPSFLITEAARAAYQDAELIKIGRRPGEKIHEDLIVETDSDRTYEYKDWFITYPAFDWWDYDISNDGGCRVPDGFTYCSKDNEQWLNASQL